MNTELQILTADTPELIKEAKNLFLEYEKWLNVSLCFQGFDEEVATLPGKYALPEGRLYIVKNNDKFIGTIALRKIDENTCEMKRLYLNSDSRGKGIGSKLVGLIIQDAVAIGYKKMRLDTIEEKMPKAVEIYRKYGFRKIDPYCYNPNPHTLFMELDLV